MHLWAATGILFSVTMLMSAFLIVVSMFAFEMQITAYGCCNPFRHDFLLSK